MKVKIKDYKEKQHLLKLALNMSGINIDYVTTDLIHKVIEKANEIGDEFSVRDATKIQVAHEKEWEEYFKEQSKNV